jgi:YD repeat-containing protein
MPGWDTTFGYAAAGQLTSQSDPTGTTVYGYDDAGRQTSQNDPITGTSITVGYNKLGQPGTVEYGTGGATRVYGYDDLHQLTSDVLKNPAGTVQASVAYGYDTAGHLASKTTSDVAGAGSNTYTYDDAGRLASWTAGPLLRVRVRRFFCDNTACERRTFAEQVRGLTTPYARRTPLLRGVLEKIALVLGGTAALSQPSPLGESAAAAVTMANRRRTGRAKQTWAISSAKASLVRDFAQVTANTVGLDSATGQAVMNSLNVRLGLTDRPGAPEPDPGPGTVLR